MAEVEKKVSGEKQVKGTCPWCDKRKAEIDGEIKGLDKDDPMTAIRTKELQAEKANASKSTLILTHKAQCSACGKYWEVEALSKPWSLELERGTAWAREQELKRLRG